MLVNACNAIWWSFINGLFFLDLLAKFDNFEIHHFIAILFSYFL